MSAGRVPPGSKCSFSWPSVADYNEAVQSLHVTMADAELRGGIAVPGATGLPMPYAGGFADVYQVDCPATGNTWAVKFFKREIRGLRDRYREISQYLAQARLPFMVEFYYLDEGVRIAGRWFPIVKLRWVEGVALNQFVAQSLDQPRLLDQLLALWVRLAARLRTARLAHADLQHGNVMLVPKGDEGNLLLKLIDYDGMWVPALASRPSTELGHRHYQHPQRAASGIYSVEVDRFSHLVICCALRCARIGGQALWDHFNNDENLLFRDQDFLDPTGSDLFHELWTLRDPTAHALVGHLALATRRPLDQCPLLEDLFAENGEVRPLELHEEAAVQTLLARATAAVPSSAPPPAPPEPRSLSELVEIAARHKRSICHVCQRFLQPPDAVTVMPVSLRPSGELISPFVTIQRHRAIFLIEDEIRLRDAPWLFPQPTGHVSRSAIVIVSGIVMGLALLFALALASRSFIGASLLVGAIGIGGGIAALRYFHPRSHAVLAIAWDFVVPPLLRESPSQDCCDFLVGLARLSEHTTDADRESHVKHAADVCLALYEERRLTYPYAAAMLRLLLIDMMRDDRLRAMELILNLIHRWKAGELPAACLDMATAQGAIVELLSSAQQRILKWRLIHACATWGLSPIDLESLSQLSQTLRRVLKQPEECSRSVVALAFAIARLDPQMLVQVGGTTRFDLAHGGKEDQFVSSTAPLLWSADRLFTVAERGMFFREQRITRSTSTGIEERTEFVQTGWTHQRRDGGPDGRYKHNPPIGYHRTVGYILVVGQQRYAYRDHPGSLVQRIEQWRTLCFNHLEPMIDQLLHEPPTDFHEQLCSGDEVRCSHCGTRQIFVEGDVARAS